MSNSIGFGFTSDLLRKWSESFLANHKADQYKSKATAELLSTLNRPFTCLLHPAFLPFEKCLLVPLASKTKQVLRGIDQGKENRYKSSSIVRGRLHSRSLSVTFHAALTSMDSICLSKHNTTFSIVKLSA